MKFKKLLLVFKKPNKLITALTFIISLLIISLTLTLLILGYTNNILGYILYFLSAVCLSYSVYLFVLLVPKIKSKLVATMQKYKITRNLMEDYGFRSVVFSFVSFIINILYTAFYIIFAVIQKSIWLGALSGYYVAITLIRGGIVRIARKKSDKDYSLRRQVLAYRNCGIYLLLLNLALIPAIIQIVIANNGFEYAGLMIYVMATYTFYKLTMAIINIFKAKNHNDYTIQSIKNIGLADSLVSILALQTAMFVMFGNGINAQIPNAITGGVVSITIITIGILMIVFGQKKLNKINKGETNE